MGMAFFFNLFDILLTVKKNIANTCYFRDNYGFVTYYNNKDAFDAIENGSKLREQNELPFDLCFGGRRQFCKTNYADLGELSIMSFFFQSI